MMATTGELLSDRQRCSYVLIELIFAPLDLNFLHKAINVCIVWRNRGMYVRAQRQELRVVKTVCAGCSLERAHGVAPIPTPESALDGRLCISIRSGLKIVSTVGAGLELLDYTARLTRMLAEAPGFHAQNEETLVSKGLATSAAGDVFCVDSFNHRVLIYPSPIVAAYSKPLTRLIVVGGRGSGPGQLLYPEAVALSRDAEEGPAILLIADPINHRIVTVAEAHSLSNPTPLPGALPVNEGRFNFRWCGSFGGRDDCTNDHRLGDPRGLVVHAGHVYIADYERCEVAGMGPCSWNPSHEAPPVERPFSRLPTLSDASCGSLYDRRHLCAGLWRPWRRARPIRRAAGYRGGRGPSAGGHGPGFAVTSAHAAGGATAGDVPRWPVGDPVGGL